MSKTKITRWIVRVNRAAITLSYLLPALVLTAALLSSFLVSRGIQKKTDTDPIFLATPPSTIISGGSGDWDSVAVNSPWPTGSPPDGNFGVTISAGNTVTIKHPQAAWSVTVNSTGHLYFDGTADSSTLTLHNGEVLTNSGEVKVIANTHPVTLQGESGGVATFTGTGINFNGKKIYLSRLSYLPVMPLNSGDIVELSGDVSINGLTTATGSSIIVGANHILTLTGNSSLAVGTFTKGTGSAKVKLNGNITLSDHNEDLGNVVTGP